jgi:hypothetical protein
MRVRGQKNNVRLEFQATTRTTERGRTKRLRPNRHPSVACARPSRASPGVQKMTMSELNGANRNRCGAAASEMAERRNSPGCGGHQRDGDRMPGWAHYVQPFLRLPARWSGVDEVAQPTTGEELKTDLAQWWRSFNDPLLNELIAQALSFNLDEKIAVSRIGLVNRAD